MGRDLVSERGKLGASTAPVKLLGVDDALPRMAQPQHLRRIAAKPLETVEGAPKETNAFRPYFELARA